MTDTATTSPIDEVSIRSERFRGGEPVTLADNQVWHFPKPQIEFRPKFADGRSELVVSTDLGPKFNSALERLDDDNSDENQPFVARMFDVAANMLRYNYKLSDDQISDLLVFRPGDESNGEAWRSILGTARGNSAPKA